MPNINDIVTYTATPNVGATGVTHLWNVCLGDCNTLSPILGNYCNGTLGPAVVGADYNFAGGTNANSNPVQIQWLSNTGGSAGNYCISLVSTGNAIPSGICTVGASRYIFVSGAGCPTINSSVGTRTCNGANTGEDIIINISGGTGTYTVSLDGGAATAISNGGSIFVPNGGHTLLVKDSNNCASTPIGVTVNCTGVTCTLTGVTIS